MANSEPMSYKKYFIYGLLFLMMCFFKISEFISLKIKIGLTVLYILYHLSNIKNYIYYIVFFFLCTSQFFDDFSLKNVGFLVYDFYKTYSYTYIYNDIFYSFIIFTSILPILNYIF